ncbi:hypothetical protein FACS189462_3750 [Spirochaetia bacterium]|nr:hypothetical protein FACS189462_3750 [Spirochaetia bacterium]
MSKNNRDISPESLKIENIIKKELSEEGKSYFYGNIPEKKEKNARNSYLKLRNGERLLWLHDSTLFGGSKEGISLSDRGIYWKSLDDDNGTFIEYNKIETIEIKEEQLFINGLKTEMCPLKEKIMNCLLMIKNTNQ